MSIVHIKKKVKYEQAYKDYLKFMYYLFGIVALPTIIYQITIADTSVANLVWRLGFFFAGAVAVVGILLPLQFFKLKEKYHNVKRELREIKEGNIELVKVK